MYEIIKNRTQSPLVFYKMKGVTMRNYWRIKHKLLINRLAGVLCIGVSLIILFTGVFQLYYSNDLNEALPQLNITTYANYCVHGNVIFAENRNYESIGQYLHISYDYLDDRLVEQVENWKAPVSVAIILKSPTQYNCALEKLLSMRNRSDTFRQYLNAHFVFKSDYCSIPEPSTDCKTGPGEINDVLTAINAIKYHADYPANIGRNVARQFLSTRFIVITDLEHLFSEYFEREVFELSKQYLTNDPKRVLIYRLFDVDMEETPKNIRELKELYDNKKASVFQAEGNYVGHYIPGIEDWFYRKEEKPGLAIADIKYDRHQWEPQFVSVANIPEHDINFPYRLRSNNVLRWELCRSGYRWSVLSKHFVFHRKGSKTNEDMMKILKYINIDRFLLVLKEFNIRMDTTYPETKTQCPEFTD